jgi:hypothetical protein
MARPATVTWPGARGQAFARWPHFRCRGHPNRCDLALFGEDDRPSLETSADGWEGKIAQEMRPARMRLRFISAGRGISLAA